MYSLAQTGPSDHLGSPWVSAGDGQHMNDFPGHSVDAEDYSLAVYGAPTPPHGTELDLTEEFRNKCASPRSESVKRLSSRSPGISSKRRNTKSSGVSKTQARLAPAPTSSRMSSAGLTGNAMSFQNTNGHFTGLNQPLFQEPEQADTLSHMYYQDFSGLEFGMASVTGMPFPELSNPLHVDPTHMQFDPDTSLTATSTPRSWNATYTPPHSPQNAEETWYQPSLGSSSESAGSSPSDYGMGQTYSLGQDLALQGLGGNGDISAIGRDDSFVVSTGPARRSRSEGETARDHDLYKNAAPQADGLFHCPWEGTAECHHKPEKLKCNYE